ncbi:MAG: hypothetical protein KAR40_16675 [Candidatus Sabulitectum sp.]|nr:hypothetical protein [Candidatus Sabulitectum sp.]
MKKFIFLILVVLTGSMYANNPEQAFDNLVDAMYAGDGPGFRDCLSSESVALVDMMLMMVKFKPEEAAVEISSELGVNISAEDVYGWTSIDLINTVLSSPRFLAELPPREDIVVSGFEINGDSSVVSFNLVDLPQPFEILMVKSGADWKLDQSVIQAEM